MRQLLDYRTLHWGTGPTGIEGMDILDPSVSMSRVVELKACSYITVKANKPEIYRHEFVRHEGRGPFLLEARGTRGRGASGCPAPMDESEALGRLIDLETVDGRVIVTSFYWVATTPVIPFQPNSRKLEKGGPVLLANRFSPLYAIEHRRIRGCLMPYILEHGIIG